jgi:hypothetical protein
MNKMKNMPGMDNIQSMLSKMGMGGAGGKMNMGAMESQLNKNMKAAQMKERMKAKAEASNLAKESAATQPQPLSQNALSDEQIISIFSTGEKVERTQRGAKPAAGKKKKGKK